MTIYIQALHRFPVAEWGLTALLGFKQIGANIKFYETIDEVPLNRDMLVVGFADDTRRWFSEMGVTPPNVPTLPRELSYFTGRFTQHMTLADASAWTSFPYFIKPYAHHKQFDAQLIEKTMDLRALEQEMSPDSMVLISSPVTFQTEYRAFVIENEWVGLQHYKGDFRIFPNVDIIRHAIQSFTSAPVAYGIDFGVLQDHRTVLIEVNDFWNLDSYGLNALVYARGLAQRWKQILDLA